LKPEEKNKNLCYNKSAIIINKFYMFDHEEKGFFDAFKPKTAFIVGLISGLFVLCTVGFFIFLSKEMTGGSIVVKNNNQPSANVNTGNNVVQPNTNANQPINIVINNDDHILGDKNAPIKLVEYSDFQCPFCSTFHPTVAQALKDYGNKIALIYRHFPLDSLHPNARPAAEASECAFEQKGDEGFFKFHDSFFTNQDKIGANYYKQLAQEMGLDMSKFNDCVSSRKYQQKVEDQYQSGLNLGVNGTPGSFVNGVSVRGAVPYSNLKQIIDSVLD